MSKTYIPVALRRQVEERADNYRVEERQLLLDAGIIKS